MPDIVETAREWIGTPFHWGASVKGVGCDCRGLIAGVARECGRSEAGEWEATWKGYGQKAPAAKLRDGLARLFDPVADMEPGDILLLRIGRTPQHLAIYAGDGRMIHTYAKGPGRVIEVPMGSVWTAAVTSAWRWRNVG